MTWLPCTVSVISKIKLNDTTEHENSLGETYLNKSGYWKKHLNGQNIKNKINK